MGIGRVWIDLKYNLHSINIRGFRPEKVLAEHPTTSVHTLLWQSTTAEQGTLNETQNTVL